MWRARCACDLIVENYVPHSPQAGNGLRAVKEFFTRLGPIDLQLHQMIAEDDLVAVQSSTP